jgi:hypothetical protein
MAMTPEQVTEALLTYLRWNDRRDWDRVLAELRSGELAAESTDEGLLIRAATPDDLRG